MYFQSMQTQQLVMVLKAGASVELAFMGRLMHEWIQLARAAKEGGGVLTLTGVKGVMPNQVVELARAGAPGHISFK
ncbi:hypothetical protein [Pseudomonas sp. LRF_L74]|uniref:hypothetical protein n=1 Tax=Pseudomonas sp. LRF_L74 TaxID=3369422 RepID=UPI003F5FBE45